MVVPPLNVLCLHGYSQSGPLLSKFTRRVTAHCDQLAKFTYLTAPFPTEQNAPEGRMWWTPTKLDGGGWDYGGVDETLSLVRDAERAAGAPFDGVMGFSQGGSMAAMIVAMQQCGKLAPTCPPLKFAWIQSARTPRDPSCAELFTSPIQLPIFFSMVEDDKSVKPDESRALIAKLGQATVICRPKGGHGLMGCNRPDQQADAQRLRAFLLAQRDAILAGAQVATQPPQQQDTAVVEQLGALSFIESPFTTKVAYEAWCALPPEQRASALTVAQARATGP